MNFPKTFKSSHNYDNHACITYHIPVIIYLCLDAITFHNYHRIILLNVYFCPLSFLGNSRTYQQDYPSSLLPNLHLSIIFHCSIFLMVKAFQ